MPTNKKRARKAAQSRAKNLVALARTGTNPERLSLLARKIAMRNNIRMPRELKRSLCKRCHAFLKPGVNCRIRLSKGRVIYLCRNCNSLSRFRYKR